MKHLSFAALLYAVIGFFGGCNWSAAVHISKCIVQNTSSSTYMNKSSGDGVHDLDCFLTKQNYNPLHCSWKPGFNTSDTRNYTFIILQEQRESSKVFRNILTTSHTFDVYLNDNMTVLVRDESDYSETCFKGMPNNLVRCDQPRNISFNWNSGLFNVVLVEVKFAEQYEVQYAENNSAAWSQVELDYKNGVVVKGLDPERSYRVRVRCVKKPKCNLCVWSDTFLVPPELTARPEIVKFETKAMEGGKRWFFLSWQMARNWSVNFYNVTVRKQSQREPDLPVITTFPELSLILSGSAYLVSVVAFNSAGKSPPAQRRLAAFENIDLPGEINATVSLGKSFVISWDRRKTQSYSCYAIEWGPARNATDLVSFYLRKPNINNYKIQGTSARPLEPFRRYQFILLLRLEKETCNLKHINDSESTYGRTEVYLQEGSPKSAPSNVSSCNVTASSAVIEWSPVPEEELRGFLQGYVVQYSITNRGDTTLNITVSSHENSYKLSNLSSQTLYTARVSAFTRAGEGEFSHPIVFETEFNESDPVSYSILWILSGLALGFILLAHGGSKAFKRGKKLFWPTIPHPGNSNAIQRIDGSLTQDILDPKATLYEAPMENTDANSLHIIEETMKMLPERSESVNIVQVDEDLPPRSLSEEEGHKDQHYITEHISTDVEPTNVGPPSAFVSDYTTMEHFQQVLSQQCSAKVLRVHSGETPSTLNQDYIRQTMVYSEEDLPVSETQL
ncbi:interleukin-31 receptor subunit alpha [Amia ocellicauda]|uniref:interleukin-31 receptor subunit alpha n=1 Tax=Amia ocellicauda TaxID=2972642 RepID=UPI003463CC81